MSKLILLVMKMAIFESVNVCNPLVMRAIISEIDDTTNSFEIYSLQCGSMIFFKAFQIPYAAGFYAVYGCVAVYFFVSVVILFSYLFFGFVGNCLKFVIL